MNENPEGTPNPLNPIQGANPVGQVPEPSTVVGQNTIEQPAPAEQSHVEQATPAGQAAPVEQPIPAEQATPVEQPIPAEQPMPEPLANEPRPEPIMNESVSKSVASENFSEQMASDPVVESVVSESEQVTMEEPISVARPTIAEKPVTEEPAVTEGAVALETIEAVANHGVAKAPVTSNMTPELGHKTKKTGLVVALVFLVVAIIAGVVAAIVLLNPFAKADDAVPTAIAKLMSGKAPKNVALNGVIGIASSDASFPFTAIALNYDGGINGTNGESYAEAKVFATLAGGGKFNFDFNEVTTSDGDLYLKLSNIYKELGDYYGPELPLEYQDLNEARSVDSVTNCDASDGVENCVTTREVIDCVDGEGGDNCVYTTTPTLEPTTGIALGETLLDYLGVFDVIDDEWVRIPNSNFSSLSNLTDINMPTQCLVDAFGKLGQFGSGFEAKYKQYPFVNYSTDNSGFLQKNNTLYRLSFDADKLAGFINSLDNSGFMNELRACTGGIASNTNVGANEIRNILALVPTIYVEIDDDNNFTRLFLSITTPDGATTAEADIYLSYPTSINATEPSTYIDINQVLSNILTEFYGQPVVEMEEVIEETISE